MEGTGNVECIEEKQNTSNGLTIKS